MIALTLTLSALLAAPTPLPGPPAGLPAAERWQLDNGLRVVLIQNSKNPWLELRLGVRIGSASDPRGKEGLAAMTGELLTAGVPGRDEQAIAEDLARLGASLSVDVEAESLVVSGEVLTIDAAAARSFMELVADVTTRATLPDDALERHRALSLAGIRNLVDEPAALCQAVARAAALAGLPEGRATFGTLDGVSAVTRDDVVAWRDRALSPAHAVLVIAGSIDTKAMLAWVDERFGGWGQGVTCERDPGALPGTCVRLCKDAVCVDNPTATPRATRLEPAVGRSAVVLVAMDDATMEQAEWRYAAANPVPVMDPQWSSFRLATTVLGGEFTSRLNAILREREGLTYSAYLSPDFGGWESGVMAIMTDATPATLGHSIDLGLAQWRDIAENEMPPDELEANRLTLINGFPFRFETVSHVLDQYAFVELADVPYTYLSDYRTAIARPDTRAVRDSMAQAIARTRPVLVVVGPASSLKTLEALKLLPLRIVKPLDFFYAWAVIDDWVGERIVFRDATVVVVDKPPGYVSAGPARDVPSSGSASGERRESVESLLCRHLDRRQVWAVHQLDRDTSGLNLFVLNKAAVQVWAERMKHDLAKRYLAVTHGVPPLGPIDLPLADRPQPTTGKLYPTVVASDAPDAKPSITEVVRVWPSGDAALVELRPLTGRTHQIRVHLAHIGCPLFGERVHLGPRAGLEVGHNHARHALHAWRLTFSDVAFEAPLAPDLVGLCARLGLPSLP